MSQQDLKALNHKLEILSRLAEVSMVLNATIELDMLLAYLMDAAAQIAEAEAASVLLWDPIKRELYFTATTTSSANLNLINRPVPLDSIAGNVMRTQQIIQVDDVQHDPRHYGEVDEENAFQTRSLLGIPMTVKDKPIGVLEVLNKHEIPWTKDDHYYMSALAAQAAVAIESAQLVQELQKANEELNELDKLKNDFIAIASHELRTPLGVILGYTSYLQQSSDPQINTQITKVLNSALQLRHIIEDLINLRYLKQDEGDLQREHVLLSRLLQEVQNDMLTLSEANGHKLDIVFPAEDVVVNADLIRMSMALTNVLNNAVRFTPPGGHITVHTQRHEQDEVWIIVSDNGIGIEKKRLDRIFDEFYQVEDHMTRHYNGLGIGLSIARAVIQAHGGRIWAQSPGLNLGTTITMTLPLV